MSKFTPGPWIIADVHVDRGNILIGSTQDYICEILPQEESANTSKEEKANAKLISKAPEVYELLNELLDITCLVEFAHNKNEKIRELLKEIDK